MYQHARITNRRILSHGLIHKRKKCLKNKGRFYMNFLLKLKNSSNQSFNFKIPKISSNWRNFACIFLMHPKFSWGKKLLHAIFRQFNEIFWCVIVWSFCQSIGFLLETQYALTYSNGNSTGIDQTPNHKRSLYQISFSCT